MCTDTAYPSAVQNNNLIRMAHGRYALCNNNFVISGSFSASPSRILLSVAVSTALVESSKISTFGFLKWLLQCRGAVSDRRTH